MNKLLVFFAKVLNRIFNDHKSKVKFFDGWNYLHSISLQGLGRVQGNNTKTSGEKNILKKIISEGKQNITIIDVGANKGQYSTLACDQILPAKKLHLHLFEPSAFNIEILKNEFSSEKYKQCYFRINAAALSDKSDTGFLYTDSAGSDLGSIIDLKISIRPFVENKKEKIEINTLDKYCLDNKINTIDLLKIDVEGNEYRVLKGSENLLNEKKIKNIQFEFGAGNVSARIFFYDFWELLSDNYDFFQIVSDGIIPVTKYSIDLEIFKTTNYFLSLKSIGIKQI